MNELETWKLFCDDHVIADLTVTDEDWPWLNGRIERHDGFAAVESLFEEELRLLEQLDDEVEQWENAYQRVRATVSLAGPDGTIVPEFLLHIHGEQAWWRWADEQLS
jgi:hypothetical protein